MAYWDDSAASAEIDITSAATEAPVFIPEVYFGPNVDALVATFASNANNQVATWQLFAWDPEIAAIVYMIQAVSGDLAADHRHRATGAAGLYLHEPVRFDLRGVTPNLRYEWYLAHALTPANVLYLMVLHKISRRPL
jgi:hypothetical protein